MSTNSSFPVNASGGRGGGRGGRGGGRGGRGGGRGGQGGRVRGPLQISPSEIGLSTTTVSGPSGSTASVNVVATRPGVDTSRPMTIVGGGLMGGSLNTRGADAVAAFGQHVHRHGLQNVPMNVLYAPSQPWLAPGWTDPPPRNIFARARLEGRGRGASGRGRGGGGSVASTGDVGSTQGDEASTLGDEAVGEASGHGGGDVNRGGSGAGGRGGRGGRRGGRGGRGGASGGVIDGRIERTSNRGQNRSIKAQQAQVAQMLARGRRPPPRGWQNHPNPQYAIENEDREEALNGLSHDRAWTTGPTALLPGQAAQPQDPVAQPPAPAAQPPAPAAQPRRLDPEAPAFRPRHFTRHFGLDPAGLSVQTTVEQRQARDEKFGPGAVPAKKRAVANDAMDNEQTPRPEVAVAAKEKALADDAMDYEQESQPQL